MTELAPRLAYALAHPLDTGTQDIAPYRQTHEQRDGNLLTAVLAVDR